MREFVILRIRRIPETIILGLLPCVSPIVPAARDPHESAKSILSLQGCISQVRRTWSLVPIPDPIRLFRAPASPVIPG